MNVGGNEVDPETLGCPCIVRNIDRLCRELSFACKRKVCSSDVFDAGFYWELSADEENERELNRKALELFEEGSLEEIHSFVVSRNSLILVPCAPSFPGGCECYYVGLREREKGEKQVAVDDGSEDARVGFFPSSRVQSSSNCTCRTAVISGVSLSFKLDDEGKVILVASNFQGGFEMSASTALRMWQAMSERPGELEKFEIEMDWCGCCPIFVVDFDMSGWLTVDNAGTKIELNGFQLMAFLDGFFEAEDHISGRFVGQPCSVHKY